MDTRTQEDERLRVHHDGDGDPPGFEPDDITFTEFVDDWDDAYTEKEQQEILKRALDKSRQEAARDPDIDRFLAAALPQFHHPPSHSDPDGYLESQQSFQKDSTEDNAGAG